MKMQRKNFECEKKFLIDKHTVAIIVAIKFASILQTQPTVIQQCHFIEKKDELNRRKNSK